jgi:hypothetical protein
MSSYIESNLFNDVFFFGINAPYPRETMIGISKSVNVLCANKYNILLFATWGTMGATGGATWGATWGATGGVIGGVIGGAIVFFFITGLNPEITTLLGIPLFFSGSGRWFKYAFVDLAVAKFNFEKFIGIFI